MTEAQQSFGGSGDQRKPALRGDLRITNLGSAGDAAAMRVFDPKSGRRYDFDTQEQMLWRAADGSSDLTTIHARQKAQGGEMTEDEVARFFRRLHVLGLLKPSVEHEGRGASPSASGGSEEARDLVAKRRQEQATEARPATPGRDGGLMARRRQVQGPAKATASRGKMPGGMRERLARRAAPEGDARDLMARRREEAANGPAKTEAPKREGRDLLARRREEAAQAKTDEAESGPVPETPKRQGRDLLARRREEAAQAKTDEAESGPVPETPKRQGRDLLARRREEVAQTPEDGDDAETPPATVEHEAQPKAPSATARALLARRRDEAAGADAAANSRGAPVTGPRDLLAKRRTALASGDGASGATDAHADSFVSHGQRPASAPTPGMRDILAGPRAALAGSAVPQSEIPEAAPLPEAPPVPLHPDAAVEDAPEEKTGVATRESASDNASNPTANVQASAAEDAPADIEPGVPDIATAAEMAEEPSNSPAKAAMAAAQKAADVGTPRAKPTARDTSSRPKPAASAAAPKKTPRSSDLMVRRLRERSGRGIAPETGKPADAEQVEEATRKPQTAPSFDPDLDFDFLEGDDDLGGMGGMGGPGAGMGGPGGMGGMRGGMMGGGMGAMGGAGGMGGMRGGMMGGGGGMGAMGAMGGGMMGGGGGGMGGGGGAMGGMRGGMMGGGMGGMRGQQQQQQSAPPKKMPAQLPLFHPQGFLRLLYVIFYPLKYILWAIVPILALAVLTVANNLPDLMADVGRLSRDFSSIAHLILSIFGVSLLARVAQGVAIVAHGGRVKVFGIMLAMGIVPRFVIERSGIEALDRTGQLWAYGSPLLARLMVFSLGIMIWQMTRDTGGILPDVALIYAQFGLLVFILTAWPLFMSDGQRWLARMLNEPKLMGKSVMAMKYAFKGGELHQGLSRKDVWPLTLFALGNILTVVVLVGAAIYIGATSLIGQYAGLGFVMFVGGLTAATLWFSALLGGRKKSKGKFDAEAFRKMAGRKGEFIEPEPDPDDPAAAESRLPSRAKVIWAMVLCGLLAVAFLPYEYQTGGDVEILPLARGQAVARSDGELVEILVREGDEVTQGQTLAQLSAWDQRADVLSTEAQLDGARATLQRLENGATPEEIEVARKELDSAEASVAFKRAEAERNTELARTGVVSQATLEKSQSELEIDLADLEVARANYNKVVAPATAEDLAIARSDVRRLEEQLAFERDELERTKIVAPIEGRVVTPNLQLKQGSFLRSGDVFLEIERTDIVTATIRVTEADISLISPGDEVRLKIAGLSDEQIPGKVDAIAPSASEEDGYGMAIRVTASFDNSNGFLRTGMTGYAKVDGEEMRVWEAYMRSIRHFFQIEVWSWIP